MNKGKVMLIMCLVTYAILVVNSVTSAANWEACVAKGPFLVLENQKYALCATASCFTYNQVLYCDCDILNGDSISLPLDFDSQNVCDVNEQGKTNGFMVSTFSVPEDTVFPRGNEALYTCPGEANKGTGGFAALGSYGQCDGGICFKSTTGQTFPGFYNRLVHDIICACPFSTSCDPSSRNRFGYQISGGYTHGCNPEDCKQCSAGEIDPAKGQCAGNSLSGIQQDTIIPVGAPSGSPAALSCILLEGNVPRLNSCLCQCLHKDRDGNCIWTVQDQSPLIADCKN